MFNNFIEELKKQLQQPLPGQAIQFEMASSDRKLSPPDLTKISGYKTSAVCILLYLHNETIYFPLIERASYEGVHSGQIALPGGKVEQEDIHPERTALRELGEETGYVSSNIQLLGKLTDVYIPPSNFLVHPYIAYTNEKPIFNPDKKEVSELLDFSLSDLLDDDIIKTTTIDLRNGLKLNAPYFNVQGKILWGATAMMLNEFKFLVKQNPFISFYQYR